MSEEVGGKTKGDQSSRPPPNYYYGTFQGVANYQQPPENYSVVGFPEPAPPSAVSGPQLPVVVSVPRGYHAVPGYVVAHGQPFREEGLPCFGIGLGWFLLIIGFFFGAFPWYIGAFILACVRMDSREKPGLIACTIAGLLAAIILLYFK